MSSDTQIKQLVEEAWSKYRTKDIPNRETLQDVIGLRFPEVNRDRFQSKAGMLMYLACLIRGDQILAMSFNQPMWVHNSEYPVHSRCEQYNDHVLPVLTSEQARHGHTTLTYDHTFTGGAIGVLRTARETEGGRVCRCDFLVSPVEYLLASFAVSNQAKREGESIGAGSAPQWFIKVPSEVIADYRVLGSTTDLHEEFYPQERLLHLHAGQRIEGIRRDEGTGAFGQASLNATVSQQ